VFDLDGTITRRDTYLAYLLGFLARHPERWSRAAPLPFAVLYHLAGWRSNTWLKTTFLRAILGGVPRHQLESWTESFLQHVLNNGLRSGARAALERHRAAGDHLVLVTASLDFYAEPLGQRLGFDTVLCTRAQYDAAGRVTGELDGGNLYGSEKVVGVQRYLQRHRPSTPVVCYCDHHSDLPLLEFADQAIAINPTRRLRRTAERIGLPIEDWT
jgi:HAD superfamily hydrolase (TIGR01490 family)